MTESLADYEALALKLAREPELIGAIKAKLARNRGSFPLFDTARFTRNIEAAYTDDVAARPARRAAAELCCRSRSEAQRLVRPRPIHFARVQVCDLHNTLSTQPLSSAVLASVMVKEPL